MSRARVSAVSVPQGQDSKVVLLFLLSIALVFVGLYPSSPILIIVLGQSPATGFVMAFVVALLLLHAVMNRQDEGRYTRLLRWMTIAVAGLLLIKIAANNASVAVRELMVTGMAWYAIGLSVQQLRAVVRGTAYVLTFILFLSLGAAIISYYLGIESYAAWNIDYLHYLSTDNPLFYRGTEGRYVSFYMPFYLDIIPAYNAQEGIGFGLTFQRHNFIFQEWSYLSFFVGPFLFTVLGDREMPFRMVVAAILSVTFMMTFSVWGIVSVCLTAGLLLLGRATRSPKAIAIVAGSAMLLALSSVGTTGLLGLLGGNKLEQFYIYFGDKADYSKLITPFGVGSDVYSSGNYDQGFRYYGIINIVFAYGIVGIIAYAVIALFGLFLAVAVLRHRDDVNGMTRASVIAMLLVLVLGVKLTYLVALFYFLYAALAAKLLDEAIATRKDAVQFTA